MDTGYQPLAKRLAKEINPFDSESALRQGLANTVNQVRTFGQSLEQQHRESPQGKLTAKIAQGGYGSLTPDEQEQFIGPMQNLAFGATTAPVDSPGMMVEQLKALDAEDIGTMNKFINEVNKSGGRVALDPKLSQDAQTILEGLGLNSTSTNKAIANNFQSLLDLYDAHGLSPAVPGIANMKQITPRANGAIPVGVHGASVPSHQSALELAAKNNDWAQVGKILDSIPATDPYKSSMESLFRSKVPAAAPATVHQTIGGIPTIF